MSFLLPVDPAEISSCLYLGPSGRYSSTHNLKKSITYYAFQHLGGIHSGCATSGIIWILLKVVRNFVAHNSQHDAILAFGVVTNVALVITAMAAFPWIRNNHHKYAFSFPFISIAYL